MNQPTLKPVRATGRGQPFIRGTVLVGLVSAAIVVVGLAQAAPAPDRSGVTAGPAQSADVESAERLDVTIESDNPSRTPGATSRPSASPTPTPKDAYWGQTFTSDLFGYTARLPDGWTTLAATTADRSDWFNAPSPSVTTLWIRRVPKPSGAGLPAYAEAHLPHRADHDGCPSDAVGRDGLHEIIVDGRGGAYRSECGFVDALVMEGDGFLNITLRSGRPWASGHLWWFKRFAENLEFDDDPQAPEGSTQFKSKVHGYSIWYPAAWQAQPSTQPMFADVLTGDPASPSGGFRLWIRRENLPDERTIADIADAWLPQGSLTVGGCKNQPHIGSIPQVPFTEATIVGRPALVRSDCGVAEAIVDLDGDALLLKLRPQTSRAAGVDRMLFRDLIDSLEIDASVAFDR